MRCHAALTLLLELDSRHRSVLYCYGTRTGGTTLSDLTEAQFMSGSQLAAELGCHHTTVSRWRNGHRVPGVQLLHQLSVVTEIPYQEVFEAWQGGEKTFAPFVRVRILGEDR